MQVHKDLQGSLETKVSRVRLVFKVTQEVWVLQVHKGSLERLALVDLMEQMVLVGRVG